MTRYEKSDAQLDAEAEARRRGLEPPRHDHGFDDPDAHEPPAFRSSPKPDPAPDPVGLARAIRLHQQMMRDDPRSIDRMVSRQPPTTRDPKTGEVSQHDATETGMNMNARLYRYVEAPGPEFPWRSAFLRLRAQCRRNHPFHTGATVPYWRGSLCQELVKLVIIGPEKRLAGFEGPVSIENAAKILRYDNPEPVLRYALTYIEQTMDDYRRKAEKRERELAGAFSVTDGPAPPHHAVPGLHEQECPQCRAA